MNHKIILSMQASTCVYDFYWMWNSPVKVTSASCLEWHPDLWWGPYRITTPLFVLLSTAELCLQPHDCLHLCAHTGWPWVSTLDGGLHMGIPELALSSRSLRSVFQSRSALCISCWAWASLVGWFFLLSAFYTLPWCSVCLVPLITWYWCVVLHVFLAA